MFRFHYIYYIISFFIRFYRSMTFLMLFIIYIALWIWGYRSKVLLIYFRVPFYIYMKWCIGICCTDWCGSPSFPMTITQSVTALLPSMSLLRHIWACKIKPLSLRCPDARGPFNDMILTLVICSRLCFCWWFIYWYNFFGGANSYNPSGTRFGGQVEAISHSSRTHPSNIRTERLDEGAHLPAALGVQSMTPSYFFDAPELLRPLWVHFNIVHLPI